MPQKRAQRNLRGEYCQYQGASDLGFSHSPFISDLREILRLFDSFELPLKT